MPGTTISGPFTAAVPIVSPIAIVEIKEDWSDTWGVDNTIQFVSGGDAACSEGIDEARFRRAYGRVLDPWGLNYVVLEQLHLLGFWIRVRLVGDGNTVIFQGRIGTASREIQGGHVVDPDTGLDVPSGEQNWTAYGPLRMLDKVAISQSVQLVEEQLAGVGTVWVEKTLDKLQDMNASKSGGATVGNRSANKGSSGSYCYGGSDVWTNGQFLAYLVTHFLDDSAAGGPAWSITGQAAALEEFEDYLPLKVGKATAAEVIRSLIARERGLDWVIRPTPAGFAIEVFSLLPIDFTVGDATIPANPNTFGFHADDHAAVKDCVVEQTDEHLFGKIRVIGQPVLICCTLKGPTAYPWYESSLVGRWDAGLEAEYLAGTGTSTDPAGDHDLARHADRFAPVFQAFGAPVDWDHQGGQASPSFDDAGQLQSDPAVYQNDVRETEDFLPLKTGWDYTQNPAVDNNPAKVEPDLLKPAVWIAYDLGTASDGSTFTRYAPAEWLQIGVSVPADDWGVTLSCSPQHDLAENEWGTAMPAPAATLYQPSGDWREMVATVAFRGDFRLQLEAEIPGAMIADGVLDVPAPDCEIWYLAPETVVDVDAAGQLVTSGGQARILRNDADRLQGVLAGVLSRYLATRTKASIVIRGWWPYQGLIGQILEGIESGGDTEQVYTPVTSCQWTGRGDTVLGCGYVADVFESAFREQETNRAARPAQPTSMDDLDLAPGGEAEWSKGEIE